MLTVGAFGSPSSGPAIGAGIMPVPAAPGPAPLPAGGSAAIVPAVFMTGGIAIVPAVIFAELPARAGNEAAPPLPAESAAPLPAIMFGMPELTGGMTLAVSVDMLPSSA